MSAISILCIEDEPEVLEAIVRDLAPLEDTFPVESAGSVSEARQVIRDVILPQGKLGLVLCDHILPGEDGVSFLITLHEDEKTARARKVLVTAQAGHKATIEAVNRANLNHYIAKPWKAEELVSVARDQLTSFVIETETNLLPYLTVLDAERLTEKIREAPLAGDE
jgi:CheY-like chemotaxis protein